MKSATGKYVGVKSIIRDQIPELAEKLFSGEICLLYAEGDKLWAEGNRLWAEGDKLYAEADKLYAEGDKLRAEGNKLRAEGSRLYAEGDKLWAEADKLWAEGSRLWAEADKLWAELAIQYSGYILDRRAMNFIAADRADGVYCFVWNRKQVWFYDGENCPDPRTVEIVYQKN